MNNTKNPKAINAAKKYIQSKEQYLKTRSTWFYNILIAEKICKNVKILEWNYNNLSLKHLKSFNDRTEEETVKYIYEQISNLSADENYMTKFKQYVSNRLKDDFVVNQVENFNGNGVIEISEILCKIMKGK